MTSVLDYAVVAALGALVGSGELVSRYRTAMRPPERFAPGQFFSISSSIQPPQPLPSS